MPKIKWMLPLFTFVALLFTLSAVSAFDNIRVTTAPQSANTVFSAAPAQAAVTPSLAEVTAVGAQTSVATVFNGGITVTNCNGCTSPALVQQVQDIQAAQAAAPASTYSGSSFVVTTTRPIDFGVIALNSCSDIVNFNVTGTLPGDSVTAGGYGSIITAFNGFVPIFYVGSLANTVTFRLCNTRQTASVDPPSANVKFEVRRP